MTDRGAPVYPTAVARIPGCLRSVSDGSQKHPMPKVASRVAQRDVDVGIMLRLVVVVGGTVEADAENNAEDDGGTENATALMGWHARAKAMAGTFPSSKDGFIVPSRYCDDARNIVDDTG